MQVSDGLVELACHARWLASHALSYVEPDVQQQYSGDFTSAEAALGDLSKPMAHLERLSDVPPRAFSALCDGVLYLLVAETILGDAPPTMHHFLRQGSLTGNRDPKQTQLLVVRWLTAAGVIDLADLEATVFGGGDAENGEEGQQGRKFGSSLELQSALAQHLAMTEPFFLGAHITVLRGLLLRYCSDLATIEDVVGHVECLRGADGDSDGDFEPKVVDDALVTWLRAVLRLTQHDKNSGASPARPVSGAPTNDGDGPTPSAVEDLYLHTNDGRVLGTVIHHYRPDLINLAELHLQHPLTVWDRNVNWSSIILAAEKLDIWVGVYPEEFVGHGFSTLQLHLLRFAEELFTVLAAEAEQKFDDMAAELELDADTTFVDVSTTRDSAAARSHQRLPPAALRRSQLLQLRSSFAAPSKQPQATAAGTPVAATAFAEVPTDTIPADEATFPVKGTPAAEKVHASLDNTSDSVTGGESSPVDGKQDHLRQSYASAQTFSPDGATTTTDPPPPRTEEEFNVVLTSLVLQGTAAKIHRQEEEEVPTASNGSPTQHGAPPSAVAPSPMVGREPLSNPMQESMGSVAPPPSGATVEEPPRSKSPELSASSSMRRQSTGLLQRVGSATAMTGSTSNQHLPASDPGGRASALRRSIIVQGGQPRRKGHNALARSVAHFHIQRQALQEAESKNQLAASHQHGLKGGKHSSTSLSSSRVQGSIDHEGIEELLDELKTAAAAPASAVPHRPRTKEGGGSGGGTVDVRELQVQNLQLRWALEQQQRAVQGMVGRLKEGLKAHDLQVVLRHLKQYGTEKSAVVPATAEPSTNAVPTPSFTPTLNVLAALGAAESASTAAPAVVVAPPSRPTTVEAEVQAALPNTPVVAGADPVGTAETPPAPAQSVEETSSAVLKPKAAAFDISLGKGSAGPKLALGQLERLKQRNAQRRLDTQQPGLQRQDSLTALKPGAGGRLPALEAAPGANDGASVPSGNPSPMPKRTPVPTPAAGGARNNKVVVCNALRHVCLPGAINKPNLEAVLQIVEEETAAPHFVVLLKDEYAKQFKGVYQCRPGATTLHRVFGAGPLAVRLSTPSGGIPAADGAASVQAVVSKVFKFDTSAKKFAQLTATGFPQIADAFTLPPKTRNVRPPL